MYELIVFDWDGTLMDSEATIVHCLQMAARDLGVDEPDAQRARDVIGLGLHQAVASLFPEADEFQVDALAQQYRKHFLSEDREPSPLFPGARELLQELASRDYFLAVATGKSRRGLDMELKHTGLGELFHATRCADEAFSKPHPQIMLDVLEHLGMDNRQALVVGDTEYDMQMAANAGSDAIGVSFGVHAPERLREHGALTVVDELQQIVHWLEEGRQE
ncbi:HAD-IA family hydrolase [Thiolapillus sp.]